MRVVFALILRSNEYLYCVVDSTFPNLVISSTKNNNRTITSTQTTC